MPFEQVGPDRETPLKGQQSLCCIVKRKKAMVFTVLNIMFFFFNFPSLYVFLTKSPKKLVPELVL